MRRLPEIVSVALVSRARLSRLHGVETVRVELDGGLVGGDEVSVPRYEE